VKVPGVREGVGRFVAWYRDYFKLFSEELQ
jgi:hypothetical protein